MNTIGERIKYLRDKNNITMKTLSEATNISKGNLSSYENNKFNPSAEAIVLISNFFKVSTDWILTGKEKSENMKNINEEEFFHILSKLTDKEIRLIELFRQLDDDIERAKIEGMLEMKVYESKSIKRGTSSIYQNGEEAATNEKRHA